MTEDGLVERVRAAICERTVCECDDNARVCVGKARAAIDVMRGELSAAETHARVAGVRDARDMAVVYFSDPVEKATFRDAVERRILFLSRPRVR